MANKDYIPDPNESGSDESPKKTHRKRKQQEDPIFHTFKRPEFEKYTFHVGQVTWKGVRAMEKFDHTEETPSVLDARMRLALLHEKPASEIGVLDVKAMELRPPKW